MYRLIGAVSNFFLSTHLYAVEKHSIFLGTTNFLTIILKNIAIYRKKILYSELSCHQLLLLVFFLKSHQILSEIQPFYILNSNNVSVFFF